MDIDEDVRHSGSTTRWLAWATAGLLIAGVVSIATVEPRHSAADGRVVAAGSAVDGVEPPVSVAPPEPPVTVAAPTTTVVVTTTVPKPAVTTTAPPTTRPVRPSTSVTTTTPTTAGNRATVTVVNEAAHAFVVTVNGRVFQLAPGQSSGAVGIELYAHGNDIVEVKAVADPTCALGDADNYFDAGGRYRLAVVPSPGMCQTMPGPQIRVTPA